MRPSLRSPHFSLHPDRPSVCPSVCFSIVPPLTRKQKNHTTFKLIRRVTDVRSNWQSNFEVKRSKVKVTGDGGNVTIVFGA